MKPKNSRPVFKQSVSRGIRQNIPNITQCEVWRGWETYVNPNTDGIMEVNLSHHMFSKNTQRMAFKPPKRVKSFMTSEIVDEEIVITFFRNEATMMLKDEAVAIFGEKLADYLKNYNS